MSNHEILLFKISYQFVRERAKKILAAQFSFLKFGIFIAEKKAN